MEQRGENVRGPKSTGADGGDLLLTQAQLWIDLGGVLASGLRRMLGRSGIHASARETAGDATADGQASQGDSEKRDAA